MELREALAMHPAILSEDALSPAKVVERAIVGACRVPPWPPLGHDEGESGTDLLQALLAKGNEATPLDSDGLRIANPGRWFGFPALASGKVPLHERDRSIRTTG